MKPRITNLFSAIFLLATPSQTPYAETAPGMPPPATSPAQAKAKSFSGVYAVKTQWGTSTMALRQTAGYVQGTATGFDGSKLQLSGYVVPQGAFGLIWGARGYFFFQTYLRADQLTYEQMGFNAMTQLPDPRTAQKLLYHRQKKPEAEAQPAKGGVYVNGTQLEEAKLRQIEKQSGIRIQEGRYWYDTKCGAWGVEGGPALGVTTPGLSLGGALKADVSKGNTKVFINSRELHVLDVVTLRLMVGAVIPGRYWLDAKGNLGQEGGPTLLNLKQLAAQAAHRGKGGAWSHHSKFGGHVGGDGSGFSYYIDKNTSWTGP